MPEVRLQKALADAGLCSRRGGEALIAAGRVSVNGERAVIGATVDPAGDRVEVDGRPLPAPAERIYLAMWKPAGVTSTVADRHATMNVLDLLPASLVAQGGRLYPVGRLDRDSEGLILLTNDGTWTDLVLHPSHGVEREYAVGTARPLAPDQADALRDGIPLEEGVASLIRLRPSSRTETAQLLAAAGEGPGAAAWYRVTLGHGWKRQVRRMFEAVDAPVVRLIRVRIGTLGLRGLRVGEVRRLEPQEAGRIPGAR